MARGSNLSRVLEKRGASIDDKMVVEVLHSGRGIPEERLLARIDGSPGFRRREEAVRWLSPYKFGSWVVRRSWIEWVSIKDYDQGQCYV